MTSRKYAQRNPQELTAGNEQQHQVGSLWK